jgi:hypothetical protein
MPSVNVPAADTGLSNEVTRRRLLATAPGF